MERKIIYHKWQCRKCGTYLSGDLVECPICKIKAKEKKEKGIFIKKIKKIIIFLPRKSQRYKKDWLTIIKMKFGIAPYKKCYSYRELSEIHKISKQAIHLILSKVRDTIINIEGRD